MGRPWRGSEGIGIVMLSVGRRLLRILHPQGIPWLGTVFYNAISKSSVFQYHYELVAKDISCYHPKGRILDVGTGPGRLLIKLHERFPRLQLTGVDISAAMVSKAKENIAIAGLSNVIEVKEGAAARLPFTDSSFDIVVSTGSMHHWKDPIASLNDVYRVLKFGGYALMYDLVRDTPAYLRKELAQKFGKLTITLFWLHSFEEPFYRAKDFESLAHSTLFREGQTRFVGALCCLTLKKEAIHT